MCSRADDGYIAKLYEARLDGTENVTFDLLCSSSFVDGLHSEIEVKNRFVPMQYKIKANEKLVQFMWDDFEKNNHWFCTISTLKKCSLSDFFRYLEFFYFHQSFKSIEFYYLSNFLSKAHGILRNRIMRYKKFEDLIDYISYGHREKSVRLALYRNYETSIRWMNRYEPTADMIICRSFDDPNLICRLINTPVKYELFDGIGMSESILFLRWLQKRYSPSSIVASIESSNLRSGSLYTPMWVNAMLMADHLSRTRAHAFNKHFQKTKMNAKSLYDELIRINTLTRIKQTNNIYAYTQAEYLVEISIEHLQFKLVKSTLELYDWGDMLQNCLFGFNERIINKSCLIIGVFIYDVLTYAMEFDGKSILQAYGKYNTEISEEDMTYIEMWVDKASKCLKDCIYGDSFILNQLAMGRPEEQNNDFIEDICLDECEEEDISDAGYSYAHEISCLCEPSIALLRKHFIADTKVYDIYSKQDKIIIETEYSKDRVLSQIQGIKIDHDISWIETSYIMMDFLQIIEVIN
jgi:hypothetical protein